MNNEQNYRITQDKSYSNKTPKIVGGTALALVGLVMFYTLVISPNKDNAGAYHSSTSSNSSTINNSAVANSNTNSNTTTNNTSTNNTTANSDNSSSNTASTNNTTSSTYSDGQYSSDINYSVPGSQNTISVTLTINSDTITDITVNDSYSDRESDRYITGFESSIESKVVGKKISNISLSRVGGASLTTNAFNRALNNIKNQAS